MGLVGIFARRLSSAAGLGFPGLWAL